MNDEGLSFRAIVTSAAGERVTRETDDRRALLVWIDHHYHADAGDTLLVGMEATGPAVRNMLVALRLGAVAMIAENRTKLDSGKL